MGLCSSLRHPPSSNADSKKLEIPRRVDKLELLKMQEEDRKRTGGCVPDDEYPSREEISSMRRAMLS